MEEAPLSRKKAPTRVTFDIPPGKQPPPPIKHIEIEEIKEEQPELLGEEGYYSDGPADEPYTPSFSAPSQPAMQQRAMNKMQDELGRAQRIFPERFSPSRDEAADATRQELIARSRNSKKETSMFDYARYGLYAIAVGAFGFLAYKSIRTARAQMAYDEAVRQQAQEEGRAD